MTLQLKRKPPATDRAARAAGGEPTRSRTVTSRRAAPRPGDFTGDTSTPTFDSAQALTDPALCRDEKTKKREEHEYKRMEGKLFKYGVRATDVAQGWISNCYFSAALAAVAQRHPDKIQSGIIDRGGDVFAVRFYKFDRYGKPSEQWVEVDADFPWYKDKNNWAYMQSLQKGELWPSLVEKAYAVFKSDGAGDYDVIGQGGYESDVLEAMTGHWAETVDLASGKDDALWSRLKQASDNEQAMTAGTYSPKTDANGEVNDPRYGAKTKIWENHAYTVMGVKEKGRGRNKQRMVILRNPWGESEPDGNGKNDGIFMITLAEFREKYEAVTLLDQGGH